MATDNKYVKYQNKSVKIIDKPKSGENVSVYVRPGDLVDFKIPGINLEDLEYELVGGDIVIDIPNQGTFTFVSMALMGYNDTPPSFASNSGKKLSLGDILSEVEEINSLPIDALVSNIDVNIPDNTAKENEEGDETQQNAPTTPQVIIQEVEVAPEEDLEEKTDENEFELPPEPAPEIIEVDFTDDAQDSSSSSETSKTEGVTPTLEFDIDIQHVNAIDSSDGTTLTVQGGGGVAYGNYYPSENDTNISSDVLNQSQKETLDYSAIEASQYSNVVIHADDSSLFDTNKTSRTITIKPNQGTGFALDKIVISGDDLPSGFDVKYATKSGNTYTLTKDNPDTDEIEGFTVDGSGNAQITFSIDTTNVTVNNLETATLKIEATSKFDINNVSEDKKADVETPVLTEIVAQNEYGLNIKELLENPTKSDYYYKEGAVDSAGNELPTGFVVTANINDNLIKGSVTLDNTIYGGIANDTVITGSGKDSIYGNTGKDIIDSGANDDVIESGEDDDTINAGSGNDDIDSGSGNDTIVLGLGDDSLDAGEGIDTIDFSAIDNQNNIGINANLETGIITGDGLDTVRNVENILGTQDNDILIGSSVDNTIKGNKGDDTIFGNAGNDLIEGGEGKDTIDGGEGDDYLNGGANSDTVSFENSTQKVIVDLETSTTNNQIGSATGEGVDILEDFENVIGSMFDDTIEGNSENNSISGKAGNDELKGLEGNDILDGGEGNNNLAGGEGKDTLTSGSGNDKLDGGEGDDTLEAGAGDDSLIGGIGNDTLKGGEGNDTVDFSNASSSEEVNLSTNQASGGEGIDDIFGIENVIGSKFDDKITGDNEDNILKGDRGSDILDGGIGNDTLKGGTQNDVLTGGLGDDTLDGGDGSSDTASYADITAGGVNVSLEITTEQDTKNAGTDTLKDIENLTGTSSDDTLSGNAQDNTLLGGAGNDTLYANGSSASGYDYLDGGAGNDDLVSFSNLNSSISIDLSLTDKQNTGTQDIIVRNIENVEGSSQNDSIIGSNISNDLYGLDGADYIDGKGGNDTIYGGNDSDTLLGNSGNDELYGEAGDDTLEGGAGDDKLDGGADNDTLIGGLGDDLIDGGTGVDLVDYSASNAVKLTLAEADQEATATIGLEEDTVKNVENIKGSQFKDILGGNSENNELDGNSGDDILLASDGNDILNGNEGNNDTIDYSARNNGGIELTLDSNNPATLKENGVDKDTILQVENVIGSQANDKITGDEKNNIIEGKEGDDTLAGGKGNDYLDGGDGVDTVDYSYIDNIKADNKGVNVDLSNNRGTDLNNNNIDTLENIENVTGTKHDDIITGNSQDNILDGKEGDDTLKGGAGDDSFIGGEGLDTADYSDVDEKLFIDLKSTTPREVSTGLGVDSFDSIEGVLGGSNDDTLIGTNTENNLVGNGGNDTLIGFGGDDTLSGGAGNDWVSFGFTHEDVKLDLSDTTLQENTGAGNLIVSGVENIEGSFGDDTFRGNSDENTLEGGYGNDTLIGRGGNDVLDGGKNQDSYTLRITNPSIAVSFVIGALTISTSASANEDMMLDALVDDFNSKNTDLSLGNLVRNGNELLLQTSQNVDSFTNVTNTQKQFIDTADYSELSGSSIDVDMENETVDVSDGSSDRIIDIERIVGTKQDDRIVGDSKNNILEGNDGDDFLLGGAGKDILKGGAGKDVLEGGADDDTIDAGADDDKIIANFQASSFDTNGKNDDVDGGSGVDTIDYSRTDFTNHKITANLSQNKIEVEGGDYDNVRNVENIVGTDYNDGDNSTVEDVIVGDEKDNTFEGKKGDDSLNGAAGNDKLYGGEGFDKLDGGSGDDKLFGDTGNDTLVAGSGTDELDGGLGDDTLSSGSGDNVLNGNLGIDTADYSGSKAINVDLNITTSQNVFSDGTSNDTLLSIENVTGSNANDIIKGNAEDNSLFGSSGNDTLVGNAGNDTLNGGAGLEDVADYSNQTSAITVNLKTPDSNGNQVTNDGQGSFDTLENIEIIKASKGNDDLTGSDNSDTFIANEGNDVIDGQGGNDVLEGNAGNDTFKGSNNDGIDFIDGGEDLDTLDYKDISGDIEVTLNGSTEATLKIDGVDNDSIKNIENITTGDGDDTITGDDLNNTIITNAGDDNVQGGRGNDYLDGGSNTSVGDSVDYSYLDDITAYTSGVKVDLSNETATDLNAGDAVGTDILKNFENVTGSKNDDSLIGNNSENTLKGNDGDDILEGKDGNDSLDGGLGEDTLKGGAGDDILNGGIGDDIDTADFSDANGDLNIDLNASGEVDIGAGLGKDTFISIEGAIGGDFKDTIKGTSGANTLKGNDGDDTLLGGGASSGYDYIDGGNGTDFVSYSYIKDETQDVTINLGLEYDGDGHAYNDSDGDVDTYQNAGAAGNLFIKNVENLEGGAGNDTLIGNQKENKLIGGVGDDWLIGGTNSNTLIGGESKISDSKEIDETNNDALSGLGIDTVDYSGITSSIGINANMNDGDDTSSQAGEVQYNGSFVDKLFGIENIRGSKNNDNIKGDTDDNVVNTFEGMGGADVISGGAGDDTIYGASATNDLTFTDGADELSGGTGNDKLYGQTGDDTLIGNEGDDSLIGGDGNDTADYSYLDTSSNSVIADFTTNTATVSNGIDTDTFNSIENVTGTKNNDTFIMQSGNVANVIKGGANGVDTIDYSNYTTNGIKIDLSLTAAQEIVSGDFDTVEGIENIIGSQLKDTITGNDENNDIDGHEGSDAIISSAGTDNINGGVDATSNDIDTVDYSNQTQKVVLTTQAGTSNYTVNKTASSSSDSLTNIEEVIGSSYDDNMTGDNQKDVFKSGSGNDELTGNAGDDSLYGEDGDDKLIGGTGNDILDGGDNTSIGDTVDYSLRTDEIKVDLTNSEAIIDTSNDDSFDATDEQDSLLNIENVEATAGNDTLIGDNSNNTLIGNAGNDLLEGGMGADYLTGNAGDDTFTFKTSNETTGDFIDGGEGSEVAGDRIDYSLVTDGVNVTLGEAGVETNVIISNANDHKIKDIENVDGTNQKDIITGNSENNTLKGNDEDDVLTGNAGDDKLYGGNNNDVLSGGAGNDLLDGGDGNDTVDYKNASEDLDVDITDGTKFISTSQGTDTFKDIEGIIGGSGNDKLTGNTGANTLIGNDGNDTLLGNGVSTGSGIDYLDGGDNTANGGDFVSFSYSSTGINVDLSITTQQDTDGINGADLIIKNIENVEGSNGNDIITGNSSKNIIKGLDGADSINASAGDDYIYGGNETSDNSLNDIVDYSTQSKKIILTQDLGSADYTVNKVAGGSDTLDGIDTVIATNFNDELTGTDEKDIFIAGDGNDELTGNAGDDTLKAGNGNDILKGGLGEDLLDGGEGVDKLDYSDRLNAVKVDLENGQATVDTQNDNDFDIDDENDSILNIENIDATNYDDYLIGDEKVNTIVGNDGDDTIQGGGKGDVLYGNAGDDTFKFSSAADESRFDVIDGGEANEDNGGDTLDYSSLTSKVDIILGESGVTTGVTVGTRTEDHEIKNIENVKGTNLGDSLFGNSENNSLYGNDGDDTLRGGAGDDYLDGGEDNDTVDYRQASEDLNVDIEDGTKFISTSQGTDTFKDIEGVIGGSGDDILKGNDKANTLIGNAGNDTLFARGTTTGTDYLDGGENADGSISLTDEDYVSYADNTTTGVTLDLSKTTAQDTNGDGNNDLIIKNIENAEGSNFKDILTGDDQAGGNTLKGLDGDDTIYASAGDDYIDGGANNDQMSYENQNQKIILTSSGTDYSVDKDTDGTDTLTNVEKVVGTDYKDTMTGGSNDDIFIAGDEADTLRGEAGTDTLQGQDGDDSLYGGTGEDLLEGGAGADTLSGEAGDDNIQGGTGNDKIVASYQASGEDADNDNDIIDGGANNDTIDYSGSEFDSHKINANLSTNTITADGADSDTVTNVENIIGTNYDDSDINTIDDIIIGDNKANSINGMAGDDSLVGNDNDDIIRGGTGYDTIDGGADNDTLYGDAGNDLILGGTGEDSLYGNADDDVLDGGDNDDYLDGGAGNDTLKGGAG
ncbi:calcium-binding protein, partial [Arcobacter sp. YIC-310]|uniref:calcium-binding protein n=1 Tax=Arcobacter sp. YIC-310 TaxID=3376632 RepID=UPI003C3014D2